MARTIDTLVIGAGQAGLAASRCLAARGIDHVVLERGEVAHRWMHERWDSLRLLTPNWMTRLPGWRYRGPEPDGFMSRDAVAAFLRAYASTLGAPVQDHTRVLAVRRDANAFAVHTDRGNWTAKSVIVATGACDTPAVPGWARALVPSILQVTTRSYKSPSDLGARGVLVVGCSATGIQLADEIAASGRDVSIAAGRHVRLPRRYRGRDVMAWMDACGFLSDRRPDGADPERLRQQPSFQLVGGAQPRDLDLGALAARGVTVLGRVEDASGHALKLDGRPAENVIAAEGRMHRVFDRIDAWIAERDVAAEAPARPAPLDPSAFARCGALDLRKAGIDTVVWATGYRRDYTWLKAPVLTPSGEIDQLDGITALPGLFVLGLPYMRRRNSTFLDGVGADAEAIAGRVARHLGMATARAA